MNNSKGTDMNLIEQYEALCARAAKMYTEGKDTTAIDAQCDALQVRLEEVQS
jgi:hypothetical protein